MKLSAINRDMYELHVRVTQSPLDDIDASPRTKPCLLRTVTSSYKYLILLMLSPRSFGHFSGQSYYILFST